MPRARGVTKQEHVYQTLHERILTGAYGPGYRFVIDTLADEFGVSAMPVREAVRRLQALGLVVVKPNAGARVAPTDPGLFDQEMSVLALLEGHATALAAPQIRPDRIQRLKSINEEMVLSIDRLDALGFSRLNREFHAVIYERCVNDALVELLQDIAERLDAIRRTVFIQIPSRGAESVAEHRELIELIQSRAPAAIIETAARQHKLRTVESFRIWQAEHRSPQRHASALG
jgi:DNA-binding GntR family transcriptional regulator